MYENNFEHNYYFHTYIFILKTQCLKIQSGYLQKSCFGVNNSHGFFIFRCSLYNQFFFICSHVFRSPSHHSPPVNPTGYPTLLVTEETTPGWQITPATPTSPLCQQVPCLNGGSCRPLSLPSGASSFLCDCPLHFTGRLCEKGDIGTSIVYGAL